MITAFLHARQPHTGAAGPRPGLLQRRVVVVEAARQPNVLRAARNGFGLIAAQPGLGAVGARIALSRAPGRTRPRRVPCRPGEPVRARRQWFARGWAAEPRHSRNAGRARSLGDPRRPPPALGRPRSFGLKGLAQAGRGDARKTLAITVEDRVPVTEPHASTGIQPNTPEHRVAMCAVPGVADEEPPPSWSGINARVRRVSVLMVLITAPGEKRPSTRTRITCV